MANVGLQAGLTAGIGAWAKPYFVYVYTIVGKMVVGRRYLFKFNTYVAAKWRIDQQKPIQRISTNDEFEEFLA